MKLKQCYFHLLVFALGNLLSPSPACNIVGCIDYDCDDNGSCRFGCRDRFEGSACDTCKQGYYPDGNYCHKCYSNCLCNSSSDYSCTSCTVGYYGQWCDLLCPSGCSENMCFKDDGKCSNGCKENRYGENCIPCSIWCNGNQCDGNGDCTYNCTNGYIGNKCDSCQPGWFKSNGTCNKCRDTCDSCTSYDTCSSCVSGYYGTSCTSPCSEGCNMNICNKYNGQCTSGCRAGYYGSMCTLCSKGCEDTCDSYIGYCSCKQGYSGNKCTNCLSGWYMAKSTCNKCSDNCLICLSLKECNTCQDGFYGNSCENTCQQGCLQVCDKKSGNCSLCKTGYYGHQCTECLNGWYMKHNVCHQCSDNCVSCSSSIKCDSCQDGFYGISCQSTCSRGCLDQCDKHTGYCTSCKDGFTGDRCCVHNLNCKTCSTDTTCSQCFSGYYGTNCEPCSVNCINTNCSNDGLCLQGCKTDFWGPHCSNICPNGCKSLIGFSSCDQNTGECNFGCSSNKYGTTCDKYCSNTCVENKCDWKTGFCTKGCVSEYYGQICESSCNTNCVSGPDGSICDANTGKCSNGCKNGFYGERCHYICGNNCANVTCSRSNGECIFGCRDGYKGSFCVQAINKSTALSNTAPFVAGVSAGVGVFLISTVVAVFYFVTKRKRNKKADQDLSFIRNQSSIGTDLALSNIAEAAIEIIERNELDIENQVITVRRNNILDDTIQSYMTLDIQRNVTVKFENEIGFDIGGLSKELFSLFWEEAFEVYFNGRERYVPFIAASKRVTAKTIFPILGKIMAHMWEVVGVFPLQLAKCVILTLADPDISIPRDILLDDYLNTLPESEARLLEKCLQTSDWTTDQERRLTRMFSFNLIPSLPTIGNLKECLIGVAEIKLIDNPFRLISLIREGFSGETSKALLRSISCENINGIYELHDPSPSRVGKLIDDYDYRNDLVPLEAQVTNYLSTTVREMNRAQVLRFLRWATGSSSMPRRLEVSFNANAGLTRAPVAHTCGNNIEISTQYETYREFKDEFMNVILSEEAFNYSIV